MAVKSGIESRGSISCPRDPSGSGDELLQLNGELAVAAAGGAEGPCSTHPAGETTPHTDNCCLHTEHPASARPLVCENTGLACSLSGNSLLGEQADAPTGKDGPAGSAAVLESHTEEIPGANDDLSDDDLEYFECSDVLTARENEIWQKKLHFLLESDEDELKLSEDCDGCARLLGEAPCARPVSGDTAPLETPIGFWGHHSKLPGPGVRGDPSVPRQSPLQADMTLAVGHGRQRGSGARDADSAPVTPAAAADEHPRSRGEAGAGGHLADRARHADPAPAPAPAPAEADPCAAGTGAAGTMTGARGESSPLLEEGGRAVAEEMPQHSGCAFTETLRRNLLKLLNPLELCRYVSAIGQSLQAAAEGREPRAPSPAREGVLSPEETESPEVQAEEADKACPWERRRSQELPEHNQRPDENVPLGDQGAHLKSITQNRENLCVEPETAGTLRACEGGGSSQPAAGMLPADIPPQAEGADLQTPPLHRAPWGERESCHPEAFSGQGVINNGSKWKGEIPAFPSGGAGAVPATQECLCAVLSPAKLGDEPGEGEERSRIDRWGSIDADPPCSPSGGADPQPAPQSACRGGADVSAVRDKLWELLHEGDSERQAPFAGGAGASLETRPMESRLTELNPEQGTCCHPPLPVGGVEEQEPLPAPRPGQAECRDHLLGGAAAPTACLAGKGMEAPAACPSANSTLLRPGLPPEHRVNDSAPGEGCHFRAGLAYCPEEKGVFPGENTCQLARAGRSCVDTVAGSDEVSLQAEGDHSGSNAQSNTTSQGCHLSKRNGWEDFQVVSAAQKHGSALQLPASIDPPAAIVSKNLPQNAEQLPETAKQEGASTPSAREPLLRDFCVEGPSCEPAKPGEHEGEGDEQERPRAVECSPDGAEAEAALPTSTDRQAQGQGVNTGTEQPCPDGIPSSQADDSIKSSPKGEQVRAAESVASGLVHLPPVDSGSSGRSEEQSPRGRTRPLSAASTACDPLAIDAERQSNQEGSRSCQAQPEPPRCKQDAAKGGHSAAGAKKKLPSAALSKKPRLEEKGGVKKSGKGEAGAARREDRKPEQRKLVLKKDSKAPRLLKKIQAESFPEGSGNVRLCCQFGDVHGDSTVTWTKDSKVLARLHRSAQDDSPVSLEIAKAGNKDQGMYYCCLNNTYGKVTAEFHLTAAVLERLSSFGSYEGVEEIEFMQLLFREDSISDSYFGGRLRGVLATEQRHFGEGMHRRAFRSRVRRGLAPVFAPGHACVLKVHSALSPASGSRDELVRRNYDLALQECCVQNAAREYAKLYAAEAEALEGFGEVPEIIPIFLIHRPANSIPYATVEEELVGEFVKYSVRDGKEVNFLRRDSEAGQKCCTFQHWVYERTSGNLLVTDLQGVGMKLTDVGIATLAKGYKGFKGNCSFSFIEQFRALHQCNEYCEMLGLQALRAPAHRQRRAAAPRGRALPSSAAARKTVPRKGRELRDCVSSER